MAQRTILKPSPGSMMSIFILFRILADLYRAGDLSVKGWIQTSDFPSPFGTMPRTGSTCQAICDRRENTCGWSSECWIHIGDAGLGKERCPANDCRTEPPSCYGMMDRTSVPDNWRQENTHGDNRGSVPGQNPDQESPHSRYFRTIWEITGRKKPYSREKRSSYRYSNSSKWWSNSCHNGDSRGFLPRYTSALSLQSIAVPLCCWQRLQCNWQHWHFSYRWTILAPPYIFNQSIHIIQGKRCLLPSLTI